MAIAHDTLWFQSGKHRHRMHRYTPGGGASERATVVVVHGIDGMESESGPEILAFAEEVAGNGFRVFVPEYFDADDGPDTLAMEQLAAHRAPRAPLYAGRLAAAVEQALTAAPVGAARLGLVGFSLGGGLALQYAQQAPAGTVKGLVDYFGYILSPSILAQADRLPPTLILHNKADGVVKVPWSSAPLLAALSRTGVPHDHVFYDDRNPTRGDHPFLPGGPADLDARRRAIEWLETHVAAPLVGRARGSGG